MIISCEEFEKFVKRRQAPYLWELPLEEQMPIIMHANSCPSCLLMIKQIFAHATPSQVAEANLRAMESAAKLTPQQKEQLKRSSSRGNQN